MDNIFSAYHYACKTKADREVVEQIYEEVKKSAQTAIYRNIGDIFFTARTDTEINGAVECNGGTYSTADFEGKQNVGNLLASGSLPYISLSEYESFVSANGSCRAFGWDGGESFRVPTIPALLLTKDEAAVIGNGMVVGLTNGTNNYGMTSGIGNSSGFYLTGHTTNYGSSVGEPRSNTNPISGGYTMGITTDPTKSGIVANLDVVEYRAMVQLANGATDQAVITATSVLQQVANKANSDLSNVSNISSGFKKQSVGWGMPDYSAGIAISSGYKADANGFVVLLSSGSGHDAMSKISVNGVLVSMTTIRAAYVQEASASAFVKKGDIVTISYNKFTSFTFYPLIGEII